MNDLCPRAIILALVVIVSTSLAPNRGLAQNQPIETKIELSSKPALDDRGHALAGQYRVAAVLTSTDGRFVSERPVQFREDIEFFGQRTAKLGSATTDGRGYASVVYQPSQAGQHTLTAHFAGDSTYAASEVELTIDAESVVPPFPAESLPLGSIGKWLSIFLAVLGAAFWVVLFGVVGRTVRLIRRAPRAAAPGSQSKEVPI